LQPQGIVDQYREGHTAANDRSAEALSRTEDEFIRRYAGRYVEEFPWVDSRAIELWAKIAAAYSAHRAAMTRLYKSLDLERTPGRYAVLRALYFAPERRMTQFEIGNDVKVSPANVTSLVDGLERDDLVVRKPHENDRRVTDVELTEAGKSLADKLVPEMARLMGGVAGSLSQQEKELMNDLLQKVINDADQMDC
jgi:DNA-binding MarR family transcriptional regulator